MTECSEGQGKRLIGAERFKFARLAVETLGTWKDKRAALIATELLLALNGSVSRAIEFSPVR